MIPINKISQVAYITADMERSVALFREKYGIPKFMMMFDVELGSLGRLDIAMAYVGEMMIELIAPHPGAAPMFRQDRLDFDTMAHEFHHVAVAVNDRQTFDGIRASAIEAGLDVIAEGEHAALDFFYLDTIRDLGHYVEYMLVHEEGRRIFDSVPRI